MAEKIETSELEAERQSMEVAEAAREKEWKQPSFLREMFLGRYRLDLVHPFPKSGQDRPEFTAFFKRLKEFLENEVDSVAIDDSGEYPPELIEGLKKMGAFGLKIPREYGGLEFSQVEYSRVMELLGSADGSVTALLSAHQSIGVPQPLKIFGSKELKEKYLPRCAAGAISAFALTEPTVGSDPANLHTTAVRSEDDSQYIINGEKLWTTNGTLAELLVVMAKHPDTQRISAFVVETNTPGVKIEHRCRFMGLRALSNAVISFSDVRIPKGNLIGKEGAGLKIALTTLNTGRLSLPAGATGLAKRCLETCRKWSSERVQWGFPIGKHEAIAHKLSDMAATIFAMESISDLVSEMADRGGYDIRLEAAAAKEWNSVQGWRLIDETMQIRGGRGYETELSLASRGEVPIPVERLMRDSRINTIFEGSSEIMHLFMAREAVDKHLQVSGVLIDPKKSLGEKLAALPAIALFYGAWYPTRWLGWGHWPRYAEFGPLARHLRFAERSSRKLSRQVFHGMVVHGPKLQRKQAFLFRIVDVANELLAMSAAISRVQAMRSAGEPEAASATKLVDFFCRASRRRIKDHFRALWRNDDVCQTKLAREVLRGEYVWMENDIIAGPVAAVEQAEETTEVGEPV